MTGSQHPAKSTRLLGFAAAGVSLLVVGAAALIHLLPAEAPPPLEARPLSGTVPARREPRPEAVPELKPESRPGPELDAGAVAAVQPAGPTPIPFRGMRWPCGRLLEVTAPGQEAMGTTQLIQLRFDGEPPLVVYAKRPSLPALARLRKALLACKGTPKLVQVTNPELLGVWAMAKEPMFSGGYKSKLEGVELVDATAAERAAGPR